MMVENFDWYIGCLFCGLEELGVFDDMLIVFLLDNGVEGNFIGMMYDNEEILFVEFDISFENMGWLWLYVWMGLGWVLV